MLQGSTAVKGLTLSVLVPERDRLDAKVVEINSICHPVLTVYSYQAQRLVPLEREVERCDIEVNVRLAERWFDG